MKFYRLIIFVLGITFISLSVPAFSEEFRWVSAFNERAVQNIDVFKKKIAERFGHKLNEVDSIFNQVKTPSDTYMTFKLSEMSNRPITDVVDVYGDGKSKGWGALAKELGIKPGSKEFHALKRQDDLYNNEFSNADNNGKKKGKGKPHKKKRK